MGSNALIIDIKTPKPFSYINLMVTQELSDQKKQSILEEIMSDSAFKLYAQC